MKFAFVVKFTEESKQIAQELIEFLKKEKAEISAEPKTANFLGLKISGETPDYVIVIGGDGTVLLAETYYPGIPLICIGAGRISFLANIESFRGIEAVKKVINRQATIEERTKLRIKGKNLPDVLNEYVVATKIPVKIIEYTVYADNHKIKTLRADGLIISTATGSTAYALSSGGPIIDKDSDVISLVPLSPFRLTSRPVIVSGEKKIKIDLIDKEAIIVADGHSRAFFHPGERIIIETSPIKAKFVCISNINYFDRVRLFIQ